MSGRSIPEAKLVSTLLCGWLHERAKWMKPSGLISYPCWSGEYNVVLSGLSTASRKNDVFSPDKIYKTSCVYPSANLFFWQFSKLEMKILVHFHLSFLLNIGKNFTTHFSKFSFHFLAKKKWKYFDSFLKFSEKMKMKILRIHFSIFEKKNKMEILLFKCIIQFWKKNENWNSFANSTFIPSLMSSRDRRPGDAPITWWLLPL